jgi:hypothetical protein
MVGEIISEWWATSNRNGGRDHSGMVSDIERNQQLARNPAFKTSIEEGFDQALEVAQSVAVQFESSASPDHTTKCIRIIP